MESSSPLANRNFQYSQGGPGRRPVVAAAAPAAPEIVPVEPVPENVITTGRRPVGRRPPAYRRPF